MSNAQQYPYRDERGYLWLDQSGLGLDHEESACFICKRDTNRLDVNFEAPFCNSRECNSVIDSDLRRLVFVPMDMPRPGSCDGTDHE